MAYVGRGTDNISNVEVLDNITFDGSSTYTLQKGSANFVPTSANNILLSIDGVVQANNFSVSGSTIDFGVAIAGTSTCNFILHYGTGLVTTVQDGAITSAKLGADSVTYDKLQNLATANRVLGSASTGLIGETQIATDMVSDDAITYGKMQDTVGANKVLGAVSAGTIGEVTIATDMITDASVDESKLKISNAPTNGQFLSAQSGNTGGLTWAVAGGGKMTFVTRTAITSDTQYINFTGLEANNYHCFVFQGIDSTDDAGEDWVCQFTDDNGSNWRNSSYMYSLWQIYSTGNTNCTASASTSSIAMADGFHTSGSDEGLHGQCFISNVGNGQRTFLWGDSAHKADSSNKFRRTMFGGFLEHGYTTNGIRFFFNSGDITGSAYAFITHYKGIIA